MNTSEKVQGKLKDKYTGSYTVLQVKKNETLEIEDDNSVSEVVNVHRVKPANWER